MSIRTKFGHFLLLCALAAGVAARAPDVFAAEAPAPAAAPDAGTVEDAPAFVIPAGREEAVTALLGEWWKTPANGVAVTGLSIERHRFVVKLSAGKSEASFVVAHPSDTAAFPSGVTDLKSPASVRVGVSCQSCPKPVVAQVNAEVAAWASKVGAAEQTVWAPRPTPREEPEPGSLENVPQGKSPEETRFEPTPGLGPPSTGTDDGSGAGSGGPQPVETAAAKRPLGRYLLLAGLIALLVWLLRAPKDDGDATKGDPAKGDPAKGDATKGDPAKGDAPTSEATSSAGSPSGSGEPAAVVGAASAEAAASPAPAAEPSAAEPSAADPTASTDGRTKPG